MDKGKKQDLKISAQETGVTTVLNVGSDTLADVAKESVTGLIADVAVDTAASLIPGLSGAYNSFKRAQTERNIKQFSEELAARIHEVKTNLASKTEQQQIQIDKVYGYIMDYVVDEQQDEKIKYMVSGFIYLTEHEDVTEDFVLTYYDVLKELRLIDISVLRLYYQFAYLDQRDESYQDIMDKHGISYDQYNSVRNNLLRLGILATKTDNKVFEDLKNIFQSIKSIHDYLDKQSKGKRLPALKQPKIASKDSFELSKFGKDFVKFFLNIDEGK